MVEKRVLCHNKKNLCDNSCVVKAESVTESIIFLQTGRINLFRNNALKPEDDVRI